MLILLQDIRYGLRMLRRNMGATFVAWLSLSLGIGAWTTVYTAVDGLLLKPLPYEESERLVMVWSSDMAASFKRRLGPASVATFAEWRRDARSFEMLSALMPVSFTLTGEGSPEPLFSRHVTANYLPVLGIKPIHGRVFTEQEEQLDARVVILSHGLWQRRFGSDPGILGRKIQLDEEAYEVIGVLPEFNGPNDPAPIQLWTPLHIAAEDLERRRRQLAVWGRLAKGVSIDEAKAEMSRLAEEHRRLYPEVMGGRDAQVELGKEIMVGPMRAGLLALLGAGGFVLLMVCGNVAHLLLVQMAARAREMSLRSALGAGGMRLTRQLVTEILLLLVAGTLSGLALAVAATWALRAWVPMQLGLARFDNVVVDGGVVLVVLGVMVLVTLIVGLMPAIRMSRQVRLSEALKSGGGRGSGKASSPLRSALVITEVALVLVLLIGTSLMVQTFLNLRALEPGRDPDQVLTLRTSLQGPDYQDPGTRIDYYKRSQEALAALPGVESVGATDLFLLGIPSTQPFTVEGTVVAKGSEPLALGQVVTSSYFETLGIPLVEGRRFGNQDMTDTPRVAVVNQNFVSTFLEGQDALLQRLELRGQGDMAWQIIGVVGDVRVFKQPADAVPTIYLPHAQVPALKMSYVIRTRTEPSSLKTSALRTVVDIDPYIPSYRVMSLAELRSEADWKYSFSTLLIALFAGLALVLAMTGIYAVMSFSVSERTHEFGVRLAFGAKPGTLMKIVLGSGLRLSILGLGLGILASLPLSRLIESQLYGVASPSPWIYLGLSILVALIVLLASCVPARRALKLDPVASLRQD